MNRLQSSIRAWLVWLAPFAVVAFVIGWETDWGHNLSMVPLLESKVHPKPVAVALMPEFKLAGGEDARRQTVERTLFNPTRRPAPPAPPPKVAAPAAPRGQYLLTGTIVVDGRATAFLREVNGGRPRVVHAGETLDGVRIDEVKVDRVRLSQGDSVEELTLKIAHGPRTTIQPAPPARPAQTGAPTPTPAQAAASGVPLPSPANANGRPQTAQDLAEILAQRRRAARAQAAAAEVAAEAAKAAAQNPSAQVTRQQGGSQAPRGPDPAWANVYKGMMQPRH